MYDLLFTHEAKKQLGKLDRELQERITAALERCRVRPHAHLKKLVATPYFRLRVGSYRVILDINTGRVLIIVIELGHRSNIYKK